ncbi:hypothetical protein DMA15_17195 [Streptomyces sp. WAC 01529]|uniref:hypothetical protein n=1 Tax=Streptomyces sp. WAC 01529 TaxID=2203205 RepID=UPI000F6C6E5F|nr:hypothetical protein [Streptomyces sp. WAC 01529]AZM54093.1 hypothetical protein DMA15_17195 [Streptomyces sp. WAC 01529]
MNTPGFILDDSVNAPGAHFWFAEPAGFTPLPVDALLAPPGSTGADELRTALEPLLDSAPNDIVRQRFLGQLALAQQLLAVLVEATTVHCAIGLHRDDVSPSAKGEPTGGLLFSLFTVSWREISAAAPAVTAARAIAGAEGHANIAYLELPCGPASFSETVRTPNADSGLPQDPVLQIFAHLPHPDGRHLVVLTLGTTVVDRRAEYRSLLQQIAENVSFEDPLLELQALTGTDARSRPPRG